MSSAAGLLSWIDCASLPDEITCNIWRGTLLIPRRALAELGALRSAHIIIIIIIIIIKNGSFTFAVKSR